MSLLIDNFDIDTVTVAEDQLLKRLSFVAVNNFVVAMPPLMNLLDQIGKPADPMKRLQQAEHGIVVSFINNRGYSAELDFLTKFEGDDEFTSVRLDWSSSDDDRPRIHLYWKSLSGITNRRHRVGRVFWLIPQELMKMIYDMFKHDYMEYS